MTLKCQNCHNTKSIEEFPLTRKGSIAKNCLRCYEVRRKYAGKPIKKRLKRKRKEYYQRKKISILEKDEGRL